MEKIICGKVRDVFSVDNSHLAIVTTDRISAFDVILNSEIPKKGVALNLISNFWFEYTKDIIPNHIVSTSVEECSSVFAKNKEYYQDRTVLVKKLNMLPYEFIVRGYIFGNMWEAYRKGEAFCGHKLVGDYQQAQELAVPILTPSKKASQGHDVYISIDQLSAEVGDELAQRLCSLSLALYNRCFQYAKKRGIIIADTKFEFGYDKNGVLTLGDEIFTPDSSRFWDATRYQIGTSPKSYDKQFVRDWLISEGLDGKEPAPSLPDDITEKTARIYQTCLQKITTD